jgi:hypothetical protein
MRAVLLIMLLLFQDFFIFFVGDFFWITFIILLLGFCLASIRSIKIEKTPAIIFFTILSIVFFRSSFLGISLFSILKELLIYLIIPITFFINYKIPTRRQQYFYFYFFLILVIGIVIEYNNGVFDKFQRNSLGRNFFLIGSPSNLFIYSFGLILLSKSIYSFKIKSILNLILSILSFSRYPFIASILVNVPKIKNNFFLLIIGLFFILLLYFNFNQILLDPGNVGRLKYWIYLFNYYNPNIIELFIGKGMGMISENPIYESVHMESSFIKTFIELGFLGIISFGYIYYFLIKNTTDIYFKSYVTLIFIQSIIAPMFPSIGNFVFLGLTSSIYKKMAIDRSYNNIIKI